MFGFQAFGIFLLDFWRLFGEILLLGIWITSKIMCFEKLKTEERFRNICSSKRSFDAAGEQIPDFLFPQGLQFGKHPPDCVNFHSQNSGNLFGRGVVLKTHHLCQ